MFRKWLVSRMGSLTLLSLLLMEITSFTQEGGKGSEYPTVPAEVGEHCIVCGVPLSQDDVALIVRGRRVPLDKSMVDVFLSNPEKYFSQRQPKGALFQEELYAPPGVSQAGIGWGWFFFGLYMLIALFFGGLSGYAAIDKGLQPIPHFFFGFFFSVFGYLYILTRPSVTKRGEVPSGLVKVPTTRLPVACPGCGNTNHPVAARCSGCGRTLEPPLESEVAKVRTAIVENLRYRR